MNKTLVRTEESARAVIRTCFVNKVFLKIAQNLQKNTCAGVFFMKFRPWDLQLYEKRTLAKVFSCEFWEVFQNTYFGEYLRTAAPELVRYYSKYPNLVGSLI